MSIERSDPPRRASMERIDRRRNERRLLFILLTAVAVLGSGTLGYVALEGWSLFDALYMTIISFSTVGYGEVQPLSRAGRILTMALIVASIGLVGYVASAFVELIIEGELQRVIRGNRMSKQVERLKDHIIICGGGLTGAAIAEEFYYAGKPFVVVENNADTVTQLLDVGDIVVLEGDATQDDTLQQAGIGRAAGLIAALNDDKANLFVVLSARALNPSLRIVSRVSYAENVRKLRRAGADNVLDMKTVTGKRLASTFLSPKFSRLMDDMLTERADAVRFIELDGGKLQAYYGHAVQELALHGALVVALHRPPDETTFNPPGETVLQEDDVLLVLATPQQARRLISGQPPDAP